MIRLKKGERYLFIRKKDQGHYFEATYIGREKSKTERIEICDLDKGNLHYLPGVYHIPINDYVWTITE